MTKEELKQYIDDNIYENQDGEITGEALNEVLKAIVDDGGTEVEANPTGDATAELSKIKIGETVYTAPQGPQGEPGATGPANTLTIGTVTEGEEAAASITGDAPNQTLNLVLPKGEKGDPGQNAVNTFKGWWPDLATLKAAITATAGDSAYVKDAAPATTWSIYVYDATASSDNYWADSGTDADTGEVQTFESGEHVNEVSIDDTNLDSPAVNSLAKAIDVAPIKRKVNTLLQDWIELDVTNYPLIFSKNYVDCRSTQTGRPKISSSSSTSSKFIIVDVEGYKKVKFLGRLYNASSTPVSGWAFYDSTNYDPTAPASNVNGGFLKDNTGYIEDGFGLYDKGTQTSDSTKEYEVNVPENAKYLKLMCSMNNSALNLDVFYIKFSGETIKSMIEDASFATTEKLNETSITDVVSADDSGLVKSRAVWIDNAKRYSKTFESIGLSVGYYASNTGTKQTSGDVYEKFLCTPKISIKEQNIYVSLGDGSPTNIRVLFWQQDGTYLGSDYSHLMNGQLITSVPEGAYTFAFNICISAFQTNTVYTVEQAEGMLLYNGGDIEDLLPQNLVKLENDTLANRNISCADIVFGDNPKLLLTGASFAYHSETTRNNWFETACANLGVTPLNKAVNGSSITDAANMAYKGTLWNKTDSSAVNYIDSFDALVIMHVLNYSVMNTSLLRDTVADYEANPDPNAADGDLFYVDPNTTHSDRSSATISRSYDYLIKKYIEDCLSRKDVAGSTYYGKPYGKPAQIIMCTSWHDGRSLFNNSIRKLAANWGFPLVQFDANIGFTKNKPLPDGNQVSRIYSHGDTETIGGVVYGWHPMFQGDLPNNYTQLKMAKIFENSFK